MPGSAFLLAILVFFIIFVFWKSLMRCAHSWLSTLLYLFFFVCIFQYFYFSTSFVFCVVFCQKALGSCADVGLSSFLRINFSEEESASVTVISLKENNDVNHKDYIKMAIISQDVFLFSELCLSRVLPCLLFFFNFEMLKLF